MDVTEFEKFLTLYEKDIYNFCLYLARNQQAAEDLYQETMLFAFETRADIDNLQNPKSYVLAIAAGKWKNSVRKAGRRAEIAPEIPLDSAFNAASPAENPTQNLERQELNACIQKGLDTLKEKVRIPLIMHYYEDFSLEEIAAALDIPTGTVKSRLHTGRKILKKFLEKGGIHEYQE
ncbi:MAG: RNA polymerase sigma factor [Turicibacter sp.]|nr:RNA polymerase sigma factor [Turicibacter sp.]